MADPKTKDKPDEQADVQPPAPVTLESIVAERPRTRSEQESLEISRIAQEAKDKRLDETVSGGRYLVDGVLVNAAGEPIKDKPKGAG